MGDIAEMMLEGTLCVQCGEFIENGAPLGFPRYCTGCQPKRPKRRGRARRVSDTRTDRRFDDPAIV